MIVRVDEFPRRKKDGTRMFADAEAVLAEFRDILRAPFCLGIVFSEGTFEGATMQELERIAHMDDVRMVPHGFRHKPLHNHSLRELQVLAAIFPPPALIIPPCNLITPRAANWLVEAGFRYVCTGPETRVRWPAIRLNRLVEVPSAFYGRIAARWDRLDPAVAEFAEFDCVTLHMCWEYKSNWAGVRRFADAYRDSIRPWRDFFEAVP